MSERALEVGQVYLFPVHAMLPPAETQTTDLYGACKVIDIAADGAVLATFDWTGPEPGDLATLKGRSLLLSDHGPFEGVPAIFWGAGEPPDDFQLLGVVAPTQEELAELACSCEGARCECPRHYGGWRACRATLYRQWRHRQDFGREAFAVESVGFVDLDKGPEPQMVTVDRVYLMHGDPRLAPGLQPAASDPTWYDLFDGTPLPASLPFLRVQRRAAHPDEGPCPDFPGLVDHIPVFSRGAVEALAKLLTPNGELVPLTCNDCDREMLAYNVTRVVDALDPARADVAPGDGKQARDVRSYTFRSQALAETSIFKLPETALKHVYVTEPFVDRVLEEGLQGFVFELMWVADDAPMLCPYCLGIMHEGTAQCPSCGLETTRDALIRMGLDERDALAKKLCAFCGTEIPEPADPCPYCGEGAHRHGPDTGVAIV